MLYVIIFVTFNCHRPGSSAQFFDEFTPSLNHMFLHLMFLLSVTLTSIWMNPTIGKPDVSLNYLILLACFNWLIPPLIVLVIFLTLLLLPLRPLFSTWHVCVFVSFIWKTGKETHQVPEVVGGTVVMTAGRLNKYDANTNVKQLNPNVSTTTLSLSSPATLKNTPEKRICTKEIFRQAKFHRR